MLGPRPGAKKRANKLNVSGLGRSLVNQQKNEQKVRSTSDRYTTETNPYGSGSNLQSVTEQQPLDELLTTAEMSGKDFTTERSAAIKVLRNPTAEASTRMTKEDRDILVQQHYDNAGKLTVPRRPNWTKDMSPAELDRLEKEAFLVWRRSLANLQESPELRLAITPFERNLEVWRQLWRVIERSDVIVQIVDARNPLLYRSEDLDTYTLSFGSKKTLLLINKSDLLSDDQRRLWAEYFKTHNIPFVFFSAKQSSAENENDRSLSNEETQKMQSENSELASEDSDIRVLSVDQLEALFHNTAPDIGDKQLQVGLVGYPNVGKSSTINAMIGAKKVSVSSTPGKTKHFQTINLTKDIMLCDCPGLVFPNFARTKAELVCQGVLPIDQLRDYMAPSALVAERIPKRFLESVYGIKLHTNPVTALDLLETYAQYRGFNRTGGGAPDASRAARIILKDYVNAKLPFAMPPPDYPHSPHIFNSVTLGTHDSGTDDVDPDSDAIDAGVVTKAERMNLEEDILVNEIDRDFFSSSGAVGNTSLPFHLRNKLTSSTSKKHHKGRKGK